MLPGHAILGQAGSDLEHTLGVARVEPAQGEQQQQRGQRQGAPGGGGQGARGGRQGARRGLGGRSGPGTRPPPDPDSPHGEQAQPQDGRGGTAQPDVAIGQQRAREAEHAQPGDGGGCGRKRRGRFRA